jgi:hypothetical protein
MVLDGRWNLFFTRQSTGPCKIEGRSSLQKKTCIGLREMKEEEEKKGEK